MPTSTIATGVVKDTPPMPRMGDRDGHDKFVETESPMRSEGMIDRGDQFTFQDPEASVSVSWLRTTRVPRVPRVKWFVKSALPVDPLVEIVPRL
jgi:hypothetical protein